MTKFDQHPTVQRVLQDSVPENDAQEQIDPAWLRRLFLEAGADDVGLIGISRPEIRDEREDILNFFPRAKTLISFVRRLNREPIRSGARSIANLEFHRTGDAINEIAGKALAALERRGVRAINPAMGFPMEMDRFPGKIWVVSHKKVAEAAGMGKMGIHRNVIHPVFGSFILLGTVVIDAEVSEESNPLEYNPCLECKLCVAACPVGAIGSDGSFNFSACYTHNYREFMGGFTDWVENIADSSSAKDYRSKVSDSESSSMWQSLSFGANYKSAYCVAVCPAGEDVIAPFLTGRKEYLQDTVKPLQQKPETVYVVKGSDAETHVAKRFPNKRTKRVHGGLRPASIRGFLDGLPLLFQRKQAENLNAVYHFTFTGNEPLMATVAIREQKLQIRDGHHDDPDLHVTADSAAWLGFVRKDSYLVWALLTGKVRLRGSPKLLVAFGKCFPS